MCSFPFFRGVCLDRGRGQQIFFISNREGPEFYRRTPIDNIVSKKKNNFDSRTFSENCQLRTREGNISTPLLLYWNRFQ